MSSAFRVQSLPAPYAYIATDENDEVLFSFEPIECVVDESDGSFKIRTDITQPRAYSSRMQILKTGSLDNRGKYAFDVKSRWAKSEKDHYKDLSDADVRYYDSDHYFYDNIGQFVNQRKLYIRV